MNDGPSKIEIVSCRRCNFYHGVSGIGGTCRHPDVIERTAPRFAFEVWDKPGTFVRFVQLEVYRAENLFHDHGPIPLPASTCPFLPKEPDGEG